MAVIKCKMCGGDLNITEGLTVAECEYCGSRQTIPSADNEKKMTLFTRAARLLRGCEFDKASGIFESIVADFPEEAEAYWGLVLCKYGIEYVDDPATGKKVPTCHRSSFDSVLKDTNFEQACENTDATARKVYRDEAKQIEELRKAIIEVSGKEEPYDVFISYKETDNQGQRTLDSVIAQDIYKELSREGYRVFFSRISLEDKLGMEYEPYIFAALNSAKLMLVVGTDYEHFDAVWVRNEWGRFLKLIASGEKKVLIPVFKNMDAYDMPEEFNKLAAQDMSKLGAMQDILHAVEKIVGSSRGEVKETVIVQQGGPNVLAMIERGNMALEDKNWEEAKGFFDRALDMDAKCADAYLGLFLVENKCTNTNVFASEFILRLVRDTKETLCSCRQNTDRIARIIEANYIPKYMDMETLKRSFRYDLSYTSSLEHRESQLTTAKAILNQDKYLSRAKKFASGDALVKIKELEESIFSRLQANIDRARAEQKQKTERIEADYTAFLDKAEAKAKELKEVAQVKCEADYVKACKTLKRARKEKHFRKAAELFKPLVGYKDSAQKVKEAEAQIPIVKKKRRRRRIITVLVIFAIFMALSAWGNKLSQDDYERAEELLTAGQYDEAIEVFESISHYEDAEERAKEAAYAKAEELYATKEYDEAIATLEALGDYKDATNRISEITEVRNAEDYASAESLFAAGKYNEAIAAFEKIKGYLDSEERIQETFYIKAVEHYNAGEYGDAAATFKILGEYEDSKDRFNKSAYAQAEQLYAAGEYAQAGMLFGQTGNYKNAKFKCFDAWEKSGIWDTIDAGHKSHSVAIKNSGSALVTGFTSLTSDYAGPQDVPRWSNLVSISAGEYQTVGLKADGTVVTTIHITGLQSLQSDLSSWNNIVAISAGENHILGLRADGSVTGAGSIPWGSLRDWQDIIDISAGCWYSIGLKANGTVVASGDNENGACAVSEWRDIVDISAGGHHTVGLKADGSVIATVFVDSTKTVHSGQCNVSSWSDIVAISAGENHTVGLKADGTVVAVGNNEHGQCDVDDWTNIVAISAGHFYTLGLKSDGTVVAIGDSSSGKCDVSDWRSIRIPEL